MLELVNEISACLLVAALLSILLGYFLAKEQCNAK